MEVLGNFFKGQMKQFRLGIQRNLQLYLDSSKPRVEIRFKLHDEYCERHLDFTKKTWNKIMESSKEISQALLGIAKIIFINDEVKVYTEKRGRERFLSLRNMKGVVVHLDSDAFTKMLSISYRVYDAYAELNTQINKTAGYLRNLIDTVMVQCDQPNANVNQLKGFLIKLQHSVDDLTPGLDNSSLKIASSDDEFDDDSDVCSTCNEHHL